MFPLIIINSFAVDTRGSWLWMDSWLPPFSLTGRIWRSGMFLCSVHLAFANISGHHSSLWRWLSVRDTHNYFYEVVVILKFCVIVTFLPAILSINPPLTAMQMSFFLFPLFDKQNISRWQAFTVTAWSHTYTKQTRLWFFSLFQWVRLPSGHLPAHGIKNNAPAITYTNLNLSTNYKNC